MPSKRKAAVSKTKMTKEQWILLLLSDSEAFTKTKVAMKKDIETALVKRRGLKPADEKRLGLILAMLTGFAGRLYVEDIWANRGQSFAAFCGWFLKEAVKSYDPKLGQVDSEPLRARLQEHFGGCSGGSCGHSH